MTAIFEQVLILVIFCVTGYVLSKKGVVNAEQTNILSKLLVYVFSTCNVFKTFSSKFTVQYITNNYKLLLISVIVLILLAVTAHFIAKLFAKEKYKRNIYEYSITVPNYGYMGYALAEGLFGADGLIDFMMFGLPVNIYIYTIGFGILTKRGVSFKKLVNPLTIVISLGIIFGLFNIPVPSVLSDVIDKSSACMAPVSMLLAGITISQFDFKKLLVDKANYIIVMLRLVAVPVVIGITLNCFFDMNIVRTALLFYTLPCGLNTIVFPKLVGENCETGASLALISTLVACVSVPLLLSLFNIG